MSLARGTVKAVLSGDTVIVMGNAQGGPPPEKQITLSNVVAPRLGRRDGSVKDEPFAWQSREFLRKKLIGQVVSFRIDQSVPSIGREFGAIIVNDENVTNLAVAAGWLRTKPGKDHSEEFEELVRLEAAAQSAGLGVWNKDEGAAQASIRDILTPENYTAAEVQQAAGTEPQDAVIDQVVTGSTIRAFLLPRFLAVTVHLSGIQCPGIRRDGEQEIADPFAREAKFFTESRLLHRDCKIRIEGIDKYQNFFGSVILPAGHITESLLLNGFAKVVEWSIKNNPDKDRLYKAERAAKAKNLRIWRDYVPPPVQTIEGVREFFGQVVEVASGDVLVIKDTTTSDPLALRRLALSSIRAPRAGNAKAGTKDEVGSYEAKEFVRSHFIGKKVKVTIDYTRPIPVGGEKTEDRQFATIEADRKNVALELVAAGWAAVQRHRGDDPRSNYYDELLQAEAEAQKQGKGIHAKKPPAARHINDVSNAANLTAAKQFLPFLQRSGKVSGIVDYVINGSRFKVTIPKQSCTVAFALSGVRCPAAPRRDKDAGEEGGEPFGEAAWLFSREHALQRDVEIEVEAQDKVGTFIGSLWVGGRNLAAALLDQGLAKLQEGFREDRVAEAEVLIAAEQRAKKAQLRLWQGYVEKPIETPTSPSEEVAHDTIQVVCTHVVDGTNLFLQSVKDAKDTLPPLQEHLAKIGGTSQVPGFSAKIGDVICARYREDGEWYRARVLAKQAGKYNVIFIDFGNSDSVAVEDLRLLPAALASAEPLAKDCQLAYLKPPKEAEYADEALHSLADLVLDRQLTATIEGRERTGKLHMTLVQKDSTVTVNQQMLRDGLARVSRFRRGAPERVTHLLSRMHIEQDTAKRSHLNIWRYGDCVESDDDEPLAGGAARR